MNSIKRVFAWFACASLVALVAVACGDGDAPAAGETAPPTATERPAGATNTPGSNEPVEQVDSAEQDKPAESGESGEQAAPTGTPRPTPEPTDHPADVSLANGALDVYGIDSWINSEPFTIAGKLTNNQVVLVDFWTYTCVNCLRTLPFLREWYAKYADRGLVILGVHAPEFDFEKDYDNVSDAVEREGIGWPVALDNDHETWRSFNNRFWPAKYLIGVDGQIAYQHFGEGAYVETEHAIRETLTAAGWDVSDIPIGTIDSTRRDPAADRVTRELYGGYQRNYTSQGLYAGQEQYYLEADVTSEYVDNGVYTPQQWYLQGSWTNKREAIVHARETSGLEDHIAFEFVGRSANVVVDPVDPEPFDVFVEIDDRPLKPEEAGMDILFDDQGRSYFNVTEARLYAFLETPEFGEHIVKLASNSDNFAIFAFTFGVYDGGF